MKNKILTVGLAALLALGGCANQNGAWSGVGDMGGKQTAGDYRLRTPLNY